jgi:hypothetical protein
MAAKLYKSMPKDKRKKEDGNTLDIHAPNFNFPLAKDKENYYWTKHGIKAKGSAFRYKIYVDESWLAETDDPYSKENLEAEQSLIPPEKPHELDSIENRRIQYKKMMRWLWLQWSKSKREHRLFPYEIYSISRTGAPALKEWICYRTSMVAITRNDKEAGDKWRAYFKSVHAFSATAYNYLSSLSPDEYSFMLHIYLKRLLIFPIPFSFEIERFDKMIEKQNGYGVLKNEIQ